MKRHPATHYATHRHYQGRYAVLIAPPRKGGRGMTVSGRVDLGRAPVGELRRLVASGWTFRRIEAR